MQRLVILVVGMCLAVWSSAIAQQASTATLRGRIVDPQQEPVYNSTVSLTHDGTGAVHSTASDLNGMYLLQDLEPGTYTLVIRAEGFAEAVFTAVEVRTAVNSRIDVPLSLATLSENTTVTAPQTLLETQRGGQAYNISGELQRELPLSERNTWYDHLRLTPAVTSFASSRERVSFAVNGSPSDSHIFQVDGIDATAGSQALSLYISFAPDAIQDVQIRTSGMDASAPLGLGASVNIATQSGANTFAGLAGLHWSPMRWNDTNVAGGTTAKAAIRQLDLSLGGPIRRNSLFFFASGRVIRNESQVARSANQLAALMDFAPTFTPENNSNDSTVGLFKVSGLLTNGGRWFVSYARDRNPERTFGITSTAPTVSPFGGNAVSGSLSTSFSSRTLASISIGYNDRTFERIIESPVPRQMIYSESFVSTGTRRGSGSLATLGPGSDSSLDQPQAKTTLALDITHARSLWLGEHLIKSGLYLSSRHERDIQRFINDGLVLEEFVLKDPANTRGGTTLFRRQTNTDPVLNTNDEFTRNLALYLQDDWQLSPSLSASIGVRADWIYRKDRLSDITTFDRLQLGPRGAVNWALGPSERRTIIKGSLGRIHDVPQRLAGSLTSGSSGMLNQYDNDLDGQFDLELATQGLRGIDRGRVFEVEQQRQPYANEVSGGLQQAIGNSLVFDVGVTHRTYRDRPTLVDVNGIYENGAFLGYFDEAYNEIYRVQPNTWNWPVTTTATLAATARRSILTLFGSYSRQWRHLAGTWQPRDPAATLQPFAFANNRGMGYTQGFVGSPVDANSLSGTSMSSASGTQWHDHAFSVSFALSRIAGLAIAANYVAQSGLWSGPILTRIDSPDPAVGPATIRLSNGRVVSNPLATTIRFAGSTRGDGQLVTPFIHTVNVRVTKSIALRRLSFNIGADVYNLFNARTDQVFQFGAHQQYSTLFGLTSGAQPPRAFAVRLECRF